MSLLEKLGLKSKWHKIDVKQAHAMVHAGTIILIDVREEDEIQSHGQPEGSLSIPLSSTNFVQQVKDKTTKQIAITCLSGMRSAKAAKQLTKAGCNNLVIVKGGLNEWQKHNLPISKLAK